MTALTGPRLLSERTGVTSTLPAAAGALIWQGAIVVNDGGVAKPGFAAPNLIVVGVAEDTVDNSASAAGARSVTVERGCYRMANLVADALTEADVGKDAWLVDDQTVARTSAGNTRSIAGKVVDVDAGGAWIRVGF